MGDHYHTIPLFANRPGTDIDDPGEFLEDVIFTGLGSIKQITFSSSVNERNMIFLSDVTE
jgi:hypothetical protein